MGKRRSRTHFSFLRLPISKNIYAGLVFTIGVFVGIGGSQYLREEWQSSHSQTESRINVCFTPQQNCTDLITQTINKARTSILVQSYSFTSPIIAQALINAKKRGVEIQVLADRSQKEDRYTQVRLLKASGIPVFIDKVPGIAHNKIIILDRESTLTGSFNWTRSAQTRNAENLLLIKDSQLAQIYTQNWYHRKKTATPL